MLKRFPLDYSPELGFYVDLPSYSMIAGTHAPVIVGLCHDDGVLPDADPSEVIAQGISVLVDIPDYTPLTKTGQINTKQLRQIYTGHPRFDHPDYRPPKVLADA